MAHRLGVIIRAITLGAAGVSLLVLLAWPGAAYATYPGENGGIAYNGPDGIWVVQPDGSGQTQLTGGGLSPSWSADGKQLVFTRSTRKGDAIVAASADGSNRQKVVGVGGDVDVTARFLPDGQRILFNSERGLRTVGIDGRHLKQVFPRPAQKLPVIDNPAVSPDGRHIAFGWGGEIWRVRADGTHADRLTNPRSKHDSDPDYSPDGTQIVFHRYYNGRYRAARLPPEELSRIAVMRADGADEHAITELG